MMVTRLAALALLVSTAVAVAAHQPRKLSSLRRLEDADNYFCDCPCYDGLSDSQDSSEEEAVWGSASVWVQNSDGMNAVLQDRNIDYSSPADTGTDETGAEYYGLCLVDEDVFDLLYDYGNEVFCDLDCDIEEGYKAEEDTETLLDQDEASDFDLDEDGDVDIEDLELDMEDEELDGELDEYDFSSDSEEEGELEGESSSDEEDDWYLEEYGLDTSSDEDISDVNPFEDSSSSESMEEILESSSESVEELDEEILALEDSIEEEDFEAKNDPLAGLGETRRN